MSRANVRKKPKAYDTSKKAGKKRAANVRKLSSIGKQQTAKKRRAKLRKVATALGGAQEASQEAAQVAAADTAAHEAGMAATSKYAARQGKSTPGRAQQLIKRKSVR